MARQETKIKEVTGGELKDYPNDQYRKFFEKFAEIDTLNVDDWKVVHILAYFCQQYKKAYGIDYKFKFNSPSPSKCFEVFQIKKLAYLLSEQPQILKGYIDWVYENKVIKVKRRLTSISFMTHEGVVGEYKNGVLLAGKKNLSVSRSTLLPEQYRTLFQNAGVTLTTYGDLAFISQMSDLSPAIQEAFIKAAEAGFDKDILSRIV